MQESLSAYLIDGEVEAVGYSSPGVDGHRHPFTVVTSPDGSKLVQIGPAGEDGHEHTVDEWSPSQYGMHLRTSSDYRHNHSIKFGTGQGEGPTVTIGAMGESCHCGGSCGPCSLRENEQQTNVRRTRRTVRKVVRAVTRQAGPPVRVKSHTRRPRSESWGARGSVVEAVDDRNIARALIHGDWIPDVGKARKAAQAIVRVFGMRDTARMLQRFGPMSAAVKGRVAKVLEPWMDAVTAREAAEAVLGSMEQGARGRRWYEGWGKRGATLLEGLSGWSKVPDGYTATLKDGGIVQLVKEGRSWVVKVDGTIIQDLGKKASFDYAEGAVAQFLKKTGRR